MILAYEMNWEPLSRDHGFPLRLIVPGQSASKSVKWLTRIMIIEGECLSYFMQREFKVFPSYVDSKSVSNLWQDYPSITHLNVDSCFTNIQDGDIV